jgi:hypothetical protein
VAMNGAGFSGKVAPASATPPPSKGS